MKQVRFNGTVHAFPDDATDEEIAAALEEMDAPPAASPTPGHGMGDLKMAESQPAQSVRDPLFPGRAQLEADALSRGEKVNPVVGALTTVVDAVNIPTRAAAVASGQDMADPNAYFWRPAVEAMKDDTTGQGETARRIQDEVPTMTGGPMGMPSAAGLEYMGLPSVPNAVMEGIGQMASDPTIMLSMGGKAIAKLGKKGIEALHGAIPGLKNYIAGLSQIKPAILEKASRPAGMEAIKEGAAMKPEDLAQQVAEDAGKVNRYREDLAANSRTTQQQQVQSINDQQALENQQVNTQLTDEAEKRTRYLQDLAANSRATQQQQTELRILEARQKATGAQAGALSDIKPGALGEDIKSDIMGGKSEMQTAWLKGDQESVGPLRDRPAPVAQPATKTQPELKLLTQKLGEVAEKYKAYDPGQGMRRISEGAKSVLADLMGHSQTSGHTIDDLLNIKAELRRARNLDKYKGVPFDLSVDDVAFGDADRAIGDVLEVALKKASPKGAKGISEVMKAKDRQYAIAKDLLGDQARSMGQVQNTANIIQKVRAMGPEKARELIAGAESNPALRSLVPKMRQAFVDDLILSSMKGGEFSAATMEKLWRAPGMQETKAAWLGAEDLKRVDDALALGAAEIGKPAAVSPLRVPMPAKVGSPADRSDGFYSRLAKEEIETPPKVGQSFSYNGKTDPVTAKSRVENIGNENEINQRALADLRVLDKINGTKHADQAMKVFEAGRLGMSDEGKLAAHPMQTTGARGYATQKGKIIGGIAGGLLGFAIDRGAGSIAGSGAAGAFLGDVVAAMHSNLGSPAGAVAAYRKLNSVLEVRFPRAAKLARAMDATKDEAVRARLATEIANELQKAGREDAAPEESDRVKKLRLALTKTKDAAARAKIQAELDQELTPSQPLKKEAYP